MCWAKKNNDEIIEEFKKIHGNKYNYSKVEYKGINVKVKIFCYKHGVFFQTPDSHKRGKNCPKCSGQELSTKEVIKHFKLIHFNKYDYSKVKYLKADSKVIIICKVHGEFQQTPQSGSGCPTCTRGWSQPKILEFLHSIENKDLLGMDAVELQMIINQGKLPEIFRELVFTENENKENTLKALKEKLQNSIQEDIFKEVTNIESNDETLNDDEAKKEDIEITNYKEKSSETKIKLDEIEENEKDKLMNELNEDLHVLDHDLISSCDAEVIEFLIQYKLRKIWNQVLNKEFSIQKFQAETGGTNFNLLKKYFFEEYNEVLKYTPAKGYQFPFEPNLMQKLTVFRLLKHKRYGNWSGTGAGKTLSFILGSRSVGARLTLIIGLNSTIEQLGKNILQTYPDSKIFTQYKFGQKFNSKDKNYLILIYDKFQQEYSEELFLDLTKNNKIDFIVIDEIHNAKQRNEKLESIRRGTIKKLITRASEKKIYMF